MVYPAELAKKYASVTAPSADWSKLGDTAGSIVYEVVKVTEATQDALFSAITNAESSGDDVIVQLPAKSNVKVDSNELTKLLKNSSGNNKDVTIDLNGSTIDATSSETALTNWTVTVPDAGKLVLANGSLDLTAIGDTASAIGVSENGYLVLRDMNIVTEKGNGVFVAEKASEVLIENCTINADGFAVTTNASSTKDTKITIRDSYISGNVGVLMNTTGELTIENSQIYGWNVAVMVRQGTAIINGCDLYSNFYQTDYKWNMFIEDGWSQGNFVPCATLLVGNNNVAGYPNAASCTITNSNIHTLNGRLAVYVEGNQTAAENGATLNYSGCKFYSYADNTYKNGTEFTGVAPVEYNASITDNQKAIVYTTKTSSYVTINEVVLQDGN